MTVAVLVMVVSACGGAVTTMVRLAEAPLARLPMSQVTVFSEATYVPTDGVADWKVVRGGRLSVTMTPVAFGRAVVLHGERVGQLAAIGHRVGTAGLGYLEVGHADSI